MAARRRPSVRGLAPLAASAVVVATALRARAGGIGPCEEQVFRRFNGASDRYRIPAWTVMQFGSLGAVFAVAGGAARLGHPRKAAGALVAGVGVWVGVKAVKPVVRRDRPIAHLDDVVVRGNHQNGCGYPSGHAAVATTLAIITACGSRPPAAIAATAAATATGAARLYVGAHLPLDVAGGVAIGTLAGTTARSVLRRSGTC